MPGLDDGEVLAQRMLARQAVRLVRDHEADALRPGDPGHEGRERAGGGVGGVEILERKHDRALGGDPAQPSQERLERAWLAALGVGQRARPCGPAPRPRAGQDQAAAAERPGVAPQQAPQLLRWSRPQRAGSAHRAPPPRADPPGHRASSEDERRLGARSSARSSASSRNRVAPDARVAGDHDRGRRAGGRRRERGLDHARSSASRPMKRRLTTSARHCQHCRDGRDPQRSPTVGGLARSIPAGAHPSAPAGRHRPVPCPGAGSPSAPPRQRAERAVGRGVALLHQVGVDDGLPLGARARAAEGPRGQQAAATDGSPDRVLHPGRRARPRPVRGRRRDAPRGGHRPGPAAGARYRARSPAGRRSTRSLAAPLRSATGRRRARCSPISGRRIRAALEPSIPPGCELRLGDALALLPAIPDASVDFVATDPPYNLAAAA